MLSLSRDNIIRNATIIEHIFISLQNTAIIDAKMLSAIPNQDFVMEEETPHGVFEDAGLGWFSLCHVLCAEYFYLVCAREKVQNYQHEVSFFARANFKTLNAWNKPFAALIIRNQGKRLYEAQGRISGLFSFTFFSAKKEKKLLVIQTACWWSLSFYALNSYAEQVQIPGPWNM